MGTDTPKVRNSRTTRWPALGIALLLGAFSIAPGFCAPVHPPKLVVLITVDQLRGDIPSRLSPRFGKGGFAYLLEKGRVYANAHYRHAATITCVGHATIATGAGPPEHGVIGNEWFDRARGERVYCVEDSAHTLFGEATKVHAGVSPRNLAASTIGDELVMASGYRSRSFSISAKDRGAIMLGGHLGKAFWQSADTGRFVTSTYYYDAYPSWTEVWNATHGIDHYRAYEWSLIHPVGTYQYGTADDRPFERDFRGLGRTFPHHLGQVPDPFFVQALRLTPIPDELTAEFAKALIRSEQLGRRDATDLLTISFSSTDLIGHAFGPDSLEAEDNQLRLDRVLAGLFEAIDAGIGLANTLIVLTADHGVSEAPEQKAGLGLVAGRISAESLVKKFNGALALRFKTHRPLIQTFVMPHIYLDPAAVAETRAPIAEIEELVVAELSKEPAVERAYARSRLLSGLITQDTMSKRVERAFHSRLSGDVIVLAKPDWYILSDASDVSVTHGSPYSADTFVPLIFVGPGIEPGTVHRRVGPQDIAPTLAALLGIRAPTKSVGTVLPEVAGE